MNWALTFFSQGSPAPLLQAWFLFQRSEMKVAKNMHPILWDLLFLSILLTHFNEGAQSFGFGFCEDHGSCDCILHRHTDRFEKRDFGV